MSNFNSILTSLNSKIEKLIIMHQSLKEENQRVLKEKEELEILNKTLKTELETINTNAQKVDLPIENKESDQVEKQMLLEKINELALEVDSCLALLEK